MKIATFIHDGMPKVGMLTSDNQAVTPFLLEEGLSYFGGQIILDLLAHGEDLPAVAEAVSLEQIQLLAPLPHPRRNIFCIGKNYRDHIQEVAKSGLGSSLGKETSVPEYPIVFTKVPESVIAHLDSIDSHSGVTEQLDYEVELAVIIGKSGRHILRADALDYVWGYTIINDVSARDLQKRHSQWHIAKSLDTFCPMGPWMVSKDELDAANLDIKCWVNGELRQNSNTGQMIFDIPTIIESLSAGITLYPGDIIATGTPSGVGMGFTPPKFLKRGDQIKMTISGIGTLENSVG